MDNFEEIPGFRGATRWYQRGGHFFVVFRSSGLSTYLRCHSHRCPVSWVLRAGQPGPIQGEHDHEPTPWVRNRNNLFQALKRRASSEATLLSAIYEEEADRYPDAVPYLLYESVVSSMRTWRRSVVEPLVPPPPAVEDVPEVANEVHLGEDHHFAPAVAPPPPPPVEPAVEPAVIARERDAIEDPASQPARRLPDRPRRQNRPSLTNRSQTRPKQHKAQAQNRDLDWIMEFERSRVQAENKMADAAHLIAEAANKIADATLINAETSRRQLEVLNNMVDVVRQLSSGLAAKPN